MLFDDTLTVYEKVRETGVNNRPGAASNVPHFHIGKTGHIPIIGDIPTWLEEVLYDN